ncbi:uncharacterized protein TRUGW13939_11644 [Talaromyces rugulosus]|uniref:Uncharacterized protein n=1 Tax=Talaromyces rugulosus TaxID=121627 RepID=A0A7H8RDA5_TALRU|nr:uncharacterized protein TRUGW13939_11644 [Talaromyces rugulosus]QKX64470.1 hypothetical protein TRUGW13939_11644 [Talaromyces rugulosus]
MDIQDFDYLGKHILTQPPQPPQKPPATFISLPRKVRDCIYDYYFTQFFSKTEKAQNDTTNFTARITSASSYNPHIQLLFTTRQIHAEASSLFYTTHFNKLFFAPETPRAAYTLIKSLAHRHTQSCYGEIRVQPNVHAPTGLSIVSGYRNLDEGSLLGDG